MASTFTTSAQLVQFNESDLQMVSGLYDSAPFIEQMYAEKVEGNFDRFIRFDTMPNAGVRDLNQGLDYAPASTTEVTTYLNVVESSITEDAALFDGYKGGRAALLGKFGMRHLRAGMYKAESGLFYSVAGQNGGKYDGLATQANALSHKNVLNANGTAAQSGDSGLTSAYIICAGPEDIAVLWGTDGVINIGNVIEQAVTDSNGKLYTALHVPIKAWSGLKVGSTAAYVRIANIDDSTGALTDKLIAKAKELLPVDHKPTFIVMNRRSRGQLQNSRVATNPTGAPVTLPVDHDGTPIITVETLTNAETAVA